MPQANSPANGSRTVARTSAKKTGPWSTSQSAGCHRSERKIARSGVGLRRSQGAPRPRTGGTFSKIRGETRPYASTLASAAGVSLYMYVCAPCCEQLRCCSSFTDVYVLACAWWLDMSALGCRAASMLLDAQRATRASARTPSRPRSPDVCPTPSPAATR